MELPVVLVILDGFGYRKETQYNAVAQANTPMFDFLLTTYSHCLLAASGTAVGLPEGYIGNSEVGHLTIGAGHVVQQPVSKINDTINDGTFFTNSMLLKKLVQLKKSNGTLHLMGLLSDAGVHSHENHLYALIKVALEHGIQNIIIHPFLDGRDVPPQSAKHYLQKLQDFINHYPSVKIGSIHGRFYAMDRDKNWERTEETIHILTYESKPMSWQDMLADQYVRNITDEFIVPTQVVHDATLKPGDGVIFFNFRPDRARQLKKRLDELDLAFVLTPVAYEREAQRESFMFEMPTIQNTLLDILARHHKTVFVIAETEKYAHVTYFFAGGREEPFDTETRVLIPSIKTKNYVNFPCMSAPTITSTVIDSLRTDPKDFYVINYANPDMVGHSGDFDATVKAIECVDEQLTILYKEIVEKMNGIMIVTADHGNAELMYDEKTSQSCTSHTTSPVYFIVAKKGMSKDEKLHLTQLSDIAGYIVKLMGIPTSLPSHNQ